MTTAYSRACTGRVECTGESPPEGQRGGVGDTGLGSLLGAGAFLAGCWSSISYDGSCIWYGGKHYSDKVTTGHYTITVSALYVVKGQ